MSSPSIYIPIFARNCTVRKISATQARDFIERHHRFGWSKCRHSYGLFTVKDCFEKQIGAGHEPSCIPMGSLVAVSCFSNARRWQKGDKMVSSYEWVRYASLEGTRVLGGMSKMLSFFIDEVHPDDVMSYAPVDLVCPGDTSEGELPGDVYRKLGFKLEGEKIFPAGKSLKYRLTILPEK